MHTMQNAVATPRASCAPNRAPAASPVRTAPLFTPSQDQIDCLVAEHPLATLVSIGDVGLRATPLPLLLERDENGRLSLLGHFARSNPQVAELEQRPDALAIFQGPHGYISPSWFTDRTQAPTWNYATVHMSVRVAFDRSPEAARHAVEVLTDRMETGRSNAWNARELGPRYAKLLPGIVAFRAEVLAVRAKFKLGQNERPDVLIEALAGLEGERAPSLHAEMSLANVERLVVSVRPTALNP